MTDLSINCFAAKNFVSKATKWLTWNKKKVKWIHLVKNILAWQFKDTNTSNRLWVDGWTDGRTDRWMDTGRGMSLTKITAKNLGKMARNYVFMTSENFGFMYLSQLGFRLWPNNWKLTEKSVPVTTLWIVIEISWKLNKFNSLFF